MTFFLKQQTEEEQASTDQILQATIPTFGERVQAQATETRILKNFNERKKKAEADFVTEITEKIPPEYLTVKTPENSAGAAGRYDYIFESARRAAEADPSFGDLPKSIAEFDAEVDRRRRAELDEARDVLDLGDGFGAEIVGDVLAEVTNPESIPFLMMGAGGGARLGLTMAIEGAAAATDEARTIGTQRQVAEDLDIEGPDAATQIAVAGVTGGLIAGGIVGTGKVLSYGLERARTTGQRRPADSTQIDFDTAVDDAEQALQKGDEPKAPEANDVLLKILPKNQHAKVPLVRQLLDFTGDLEAPRGYDQIYSGIRKQDYPPKPLTQMSIKEVLAWQDSIDPKYQSEASGRFQFMEDTLRPLYKKLGLTGDELFNEAMQDRLAIALMREKGLDAFLAGRMSARTFGQNLSKVWAGLPQLQGSGRGRSFYAGLAGNKSLSSADRFEKVLGAAGVYTPRARDGGSTPYQGGTSRGFTRDGQVSVGNDTRIDVRYEVVDLATLQRATGDLQPRDRSRASSDEQINEIASGLDPARLLPSPEADRGAPIVGPDNIIESGNGRVMGIERAYQKFPDRSAAYREQIEAAGFAVPEGVEQPVLIARRSTEFSPEQRASFVRDANVSSTARMSATERAAMDARNVDADTIALFDPAQPLSSRANVPFTQRMLSKLPQSERNALVGSSGALNAEGVSRVRQAMFARAFDAPDIVARYAEADAGDLRGLMDAMEGAAPAWASMRSAMQDGRLRTQLDPTPYLLDAMRLIGDARMIAARENKRSADMVEELLADVDLLSGGVAPLTAALVRKLYPGGRVLSAPKVTAFMDDFAAEAHKVGKTDAALFDDEVGLLDLLKSLDASTFGDLTELGTAKVVNGRIGSAADVVSDAMPEAAFADGASSPRAQEAGDEIAEQLGSRGKNDPIPETKNVNEKIQVSNRSIAGKISIRHAFNTSDYSGVPPSLSKDFDGDRYDANSFGNEGIYLDIAGNWTEPSDTANFYFGEFATGNATVKNSLFLTPENAKSVAEDLQFEPVDVAEKLASGDVIRDANGKVSTYRKEYPDGRDLVAWARAKGYDGVIISPEFDKKITSYNDELAAPETYGFQHAVLQSQAFLFDVNNVSFDKKTWDPKDPRRPTPPDLIADIEKSDAGDEAEIRALVDELARDGEISVLMADGATLNTREILNDLDQDDILNTVISACGVKGAA